jgi:hypothetical protein
MVAINESVGEGGGGSVGSGNETGADGETGFGVGVGGLACWVSEIAVSMASTEGVGSRVVHPTRQIHRKRVIRICVFMGPPLILY